MKKLKCVICGKSIPDNKLTWVANIRSSKNDSLPVHKGKCREEGYYRYSVRM